MQEMYNAKLGSPITTLAEDISPSQTTITVADASFLGAAPNIATITTGVNSETVKYTGITLNTLTGVTRGFQGSAQAWASGTNIARIITAYDHDTFLANINEVDGDLDTHKAESASKHITESGANVNGRYIKFDDGTMICSHRNPATSVGANEILGLTWTFPATFISGATVQVVLTPNFDSSLTVPSVSSRLIQSINATLAIKNNFTTALNISLGMVAIGRWKA